MKAEERKADNAEVTAIIIRGIIGKGAEPFLPYGFEEYVAERIREAEQQARREALEEAARIVEKEAITEASAVTCGYAYNNAIGDSVYAIRALIEREGGE